MPFHTGVFGNGTIYLTPPANVPDGTRAYVYILGPGEDPVSFYRRLVLLEPEDARLYNQLGMAQIEASRLADAQASLSRAIQLDFGFADAHFNLGRCYEQEGQRDSARQSYMAAADLAPDEARFQRQLITFLIMEEDVDGVFAALQAALEAAPRLRGWVEDDALLAPLRDDPRWAALLASES
ncbi:MAG: tetratricopeptide repeat protein [Anaerolineae bacterium]|nr:tetratricopeptide repeat protein [Anaerolineae bacterium]